MSRFAVVSLAVGLFSAAGCGYDVHQVNFILRRAPNLTDVDINALDPIATFTGYDQTGSVVIDWNLDEKVSDGDMTARDLIRAGAVEFSWGTGYEGAPCFTVVGYQGGMPAVFAYGCSLIPQPPNESPAEMCLSPTGPQPRTCVP